MELDVDKPDSARRNGRVLQQPPALCAPGPGVYGKTRASARLGDRPSGAEHPARSYPRQREGELPQERGLKAL